MTRRRRVSRREAAEKHDALGRERRIASREARAVEEIEFARSLERTWKITGYDIRGMFHGRYDRDELRKVPVPIRRLAPHLCSCNTPLQLEKYERLLTEIVDKAPKLLREDYLFLVYGLRDSLWIRPIEDWIPRGRSPRAIFISLVDHLFVRYKVPGFLYGTFFEYTGEHSGPDFLHLFEAVAKGGSPYRYLRGYKGIPVTRRMCRRFMETSAGTPLMVGLRRAQVEALGGDRRLADRICGTFLGRELQISEAFWQGVIHWFCNHWTGDSRKVGPLLDYIKHCWEENRGFSMKGRSPHTLIQGMEEWHRDLARLKALEKYTFKPSGFSGMNWEEKKKVGVNAFKVETWVIEEILTSKDLVAEGSKMKHCVASYSDGIKEGGSSIWSVKKDDERRLTIEIDNRNRCIAQVAGPCNESASDKEKAMVRKWARENNIRIQKNAWW